MRSRYTAFVVGDRAHLERSWHPATRPVDIGLDPAVRWRGLDVIDASASGEEATVEFRARWESAGERGTIVERSRFVRRAGRWVYRDGKVSRER